MSRSPLCVITLCKHARRAISQRPHLCLFSLRIQVPFSPETDQVRSGPLSTQLWPVELSMMTAVCYVCAVHMWLLSI